MSVPVTVFDDADTLGEAVAAEIAVRFRPGRRFVLGCPGGRSPRTTYQAFARLGAERGLDLSDMHIVMMDEYLVAAPGGWRRCPETAHFSCGGFGHREIRRPFNAGLPAAKQIPPEHLHVPDPDDPAGYDNLIEKLGGIDLFLLASGASDGHVAFNPPGTPLSQRTHVVELALTTRRDNMATFPEFGCIEETPSHGITVGPGTIAHWSRAAIMILIGCDKAATFQRITRAGGYQPDWPATVVQACREPAVFADRAAAGDPRRAL